jgi:predicted RNase H-like HicB family nuclease
MQFTIVIEGDERGGFSAYVPALEGVVATGRTEQLVRSRIESGIAYHISKLRESGREIPPPSVHIYQVELAL